MNVTVTRSSPLINDLKTDFDGQKFYAVVVTFYPDESVLENIRITLGYYPFVVVVDNTGTDVSKRLLSRLDEKSRVEVICNSENVGIAEALNQAVSRASELGAAWVTTFDQDSWLAVDYPSMVKQGLVESSNREQPPIFGCRYIDPASVNKELHKYTCTGLCFEYIDEVITSGMTFSVKTWKVLGGFDSQLFIDFVDNDFCAKARIKNIECLITKRPVLVHSLGSLDVRKFFWKKLYSRNHMPLRCYYIARNVVIYARRYRKNSPENVVGHLKRVLKKQIIIILIEEKKTLKIFASFVGAIDGFLGKIGKTPRKFD